MISAETITLIMDIILYVLLALILLKCILGLFKGLWKTSCSLIISIIFYILVVTLNTTFTDMYYSMDLSFITNQPFLVNGVEVSLTTAGDTLRNLILALTNGSLELSSTSRVFLVCDALAKSILSFIVFIIHILLVTFVIAPFVSFIIYHLILKNILGKNITKKHKLRLAGFFVGGIKAAITTALLLTPFTALANQIGSVVNQEEYQFEGESAELKKYINAYTESSLAKVFTSIQIDGNSIDVSLTNYATSFNIDDENSINFLDELAMVTDIACEGISEGIISLNGVSMEASSFLSKKFVTKVLIKLADSPLVTTLLPVALGIVVNLDSIKSSMDLTSIDWNKIDWSDELKALSDVYSEFYDTGLINAVLDPEELNKFEFNRETYPHFKNTFENLNKVEVLKEVMPYVFTSFAKSLNGTDFEGLLPIDIEYYKTSVDIGYELTCIYDSVMTLSDISSYVLNDSTVVENNRVKNVANNETRRFLTIGDLQDPEKMNEIIAFLLSKKGVDGGENVNNEFVEYVSSTDNEYHISTELVFNGYQDTNNDVKGLLDSSLLSDNITTLLKFAFNSTEQMQDFNLGEVLDEIENESDKFNWKNEISSLLHICSIIVNNPDLPLDAFDIFNESQVEQLKQITPYIDDSDLLPKIVPSIVTSLLGEEEIIYGLKASDFDFGCENLGSELNKLLSVLPKINNVKNNLSGGLNAFLDSNSTFDTELEEVLLTVINSKILNPSIDGTEKKLNNFETLLKNIFSNDLKDVGFEPMTEEFLINIRNSYGGWDTEIKNICNALGCMKDLDSIKKMIDPEKYNNNEVIALTDIETSEISALIHDFSSSIIIENSMGSILNKYLKQQMVDMGLTIDFKAVTDWGHEADYLCETIDIFKELTSHSFALDNIDIQSLRYYAEDEEGNIITGADELGALLESIYSLECISEEVQNGDEITYKHAFDDIVYNVTENVLGDYISDESKTQIEKDHNLEFENIMFNSSSRVVWASEEETDAGQCVINDIVSLLNHVLGTEDKVSQNLDNSYFHEDGTLDLMKALEKEGELENLLGLVNNIYIWRTILSDMIPTIIDDVIVDMKFDGLDLSLLNSYTFKNDLTFPCDSLQTREQEIAIRNHEITKISDVYQDLDLFYEEAYEEESNAIVLTIEKIQSEDIQNSLRALLSDMASSKLFNEIKVVDGEMKSHTFFQDILRYMLDISSISSMMDYQINSTLNEEELNASANARALNAILSINNESSENNGWISAEIDNFIDAITDASNVASLFSETGSLDGLDGKKVEQVIKSFAKSKVLNYQNSLGNILNSQVRSTFEGTGLNIDFTKVGEYKPNNGIIETNEERQHRINEWNLEAEHFSALIDNIKNINGTESSSFDLNINLNDVNTDSLEKVLNSLSELLVVQRNTVTKEINGKTIVMDNYGNFVYTKVTEISFGQYINNDNLLNILNDHNIQNNNFAYSDSSKISWASEDNEYKGENHNIISLIKNLQEGGFVDGQGNVAFGDVEVDDSTRNLINNLNENNIFRSIIKPILNEKIDSLGGTINGINPQKAYVSVFDNELNYQSVNKIVDNRFLEINSRKEELNLLINIFNEMSDLENEQGSGEGADQYTSLVGSSIDDKGTIEKLLLDTHNSWLLNNNEAEFKDEFTVFEDTVKYVMDSTTLSSMIEYEYKSISLEDTKIETVIENITKSEETHNPIKWIDEVVNGEVVKGEITKLCDVIYKLVNVESKEIDPITGQNKHLTFTNPDQITNINSESAKELMYLLNESYLCHGAIGNVVNQIYDNTGIKYYALDKNNLINAYELDFEFVNYFEYQVDAWRKDIEPLFNLYDIVGSGNDVYDSIITVDEYGNEIVNDNVFTTLLPNIMVLNNISNCRSDVLYGLFREISIQEYLYEYPSSYTSSYVDENANTNELTHYTYKLYDFQRRETLNKLISKVGIDHNWEFEGQKLDNIVTIMFNNGGATSLKELDSKLVNDVMKGTYSYNDQLEISDGNYERKYTRGYLASELVSSFISEVTSTFVSNVEEEQEEYLKYFWRGKQSENIPSFEYKSLNKYEIEALASLIDVTTYLSDFTDNIKDFTDEYYASWKNNYYQAMIIMGQEVNDLEKVSFLGENQHNSIIAEKIWSKFCSQETGEFNSKFGITGFSPNWNLNGKTFEEKYLSEWEIAFDAIYNNRHLL